ncbi:MAG: J domain-containing protein [Candidatus Microthrix sp.]|nr:J domain-containing protein [Candidatus Microthrix sp.]
MTPSDARALLGVSPQATHDEVRAAFRAQIGRHHPDVNPAPGTSARAMALIEAWEVLSVEPAVTDPPVTTPRSQTPRSQVPWRRGRPGRRSWPPPLRTRSCCG